MRQCAAETNDAYNKICKVEPRRLLKFFGGGQMHSSLHLFGTHAENKGGFVRKGKRRECGTAYLISSSSCAKGEDDRRWRIREAPAK